MVSQLLKLRSINLNICQDTEFTFQILENLPGNGYRNGPKDSEMLEHRLQREGYWIKILRIVYP